MADENKAPSFNAIWFESAKAARAAQIDYGRWIVNTLWLMHSGAIAGLLSRWNGKDALPHSTALLFFVLGIVLAFVTAALAWFNFSVAEDWFKRWTYAGERWSEENIDEHSDWLRRTTYGAIAAVIGSIICLVVGAAYVLWWT